ncbi:MAG: hypothetical protein FWG21_07095 [Oscillospiraceae bacterium]|nr:hypothetical protein [Oscillospiraceae bacterium]
MQQYSIRHPSYLQIHDELKVYMGADQDWYEKAWQKRAGCGPTTASMAMFYLLNRQHNEAESLTSLRNSKHEFLELMNEMWFHVTPGYRGVNTTAIFTRGCLEYAGKYGIDLSIKTLAVPADKKQRPTRERLAEFIIEALEKDCPVSFLNLHNGEEKNLDRWHWVLLVSFDPTDGKAIMYDQGVSGCIDMYLWLNTTLYGGGLVTLDEA